MRANTTVLYCVCAALMGMAGTAPCQTPAPLPDPTRPPPEALLAPGEVVAAPVTVAPTLQSVLISERPGGRRVAVIDGETVRLGGSFNGAVLVRVSATEVALRRGKTIEVLALSDQPPPAPAGKPPVAPAAKPAVAPAAEPQQLPSAAALLKMLTQ